MRGDANVQSIELAANVFLFRVLQFPMDDDGYFSIDTDSHYVETWRAMEKLVVGGKAPSLCLCPWPIKRTFLHGVASIFYIAQPAHPNRPAWFACAPWQDEGKVRSIGISNFNKRQVNANRKPARRIVAFFIHGVGWGKV